MRKNIKIYLICIFLIHYIYSIHIIQVFSFVCVLIWSLLGVKKAWPTHRSVSFRGLIQNFRRASPPLSYARSPRAQLERIDTINIFFVSFSTEKEFFFSRFYTSQILFTLQKQQIHRKLKEFPVLKMYFSFAKISVSLV